MKPRWEFPAEWALTPERKKALEEKRERARKVEDDKRENGKLVDGKTVIETSLPFMEEAARVAEPVMVGGKRGR